MASYQPPIENLAIFDPIVFNTNDAPLTIDEASKLFLKFPDAQGTENLQSINVNGIATFNTSANFNTTTTTTGLATFNGGINDNGNLTISGNARRIQGDFTNATFANRTMLQTSTVNGITSIGILPNGTQTACGIRSFNNSDPTNAGSLGLTSNITNHLIQGQISGTGVHIPLNIANGGTTAITLSTTGQVSLPTNLTLSNPTTTTDGTYTSTTKVVPYNTVALTGGQIAIGSSAGTTSQGDRSIAIGTGAGQASQTAGSICLNASGVALNPSTAGTYINPITDVPLNTTEFIKPMYYTASSGGGNQYELVSGTSATIRTTGNVANTTITTNVIYNILSTPITLIPGTWLLNIYIQASGTVPGTTSFITALFGGLSTTTTNFAGGTGSLRIREAYVLPNTTLTAGGNYTSILQVSSTQTLYLNAQFNFSGPVNLTMANGASFVQYTRIA